LIDLLQRLLLISFFALWVQSAFSFDLSNEHVKKVDRYMTNLKTVDAIEYIDSLFSNKSPLSTAIKQDLIIYRSQALQRLDQYDEDLKYCRKMSKKYPNDEIFQIRLLLETTVMYEITREMEKFFAGMKKIEALLTNYPTSEYYAEYLIRWTSYHRGQKDIPEAQRYANECLELTIAHGHKLQEAVTRTLIGYMSEDEAISDYQLRMALQYWIEINDLHWVGAIYGSFTKREFYRKDYKAALAYSDSSIQAVKNATNKSPLVAPYYWRSQIYEALGQLDSALLYYKKHVAATDDMATYERDEALRKLDYIYGEEKNKAKLEKTEREAKIARERNRQFFITIVVLVGFVLLISYLVIRLRNSRKKIRVQNETLSENNGQLEQLVSDKTVLIQEVNHRVKNNLTLILSLIDYQKMTKKSGDFGALKNRINSIAVAHQLLLTNYDATTTEEMLSLRQYLEQVIEPVVQLDGRTVEQEVHIDEVVLNTDTLVPIGMLVNELISNTLKHAKPEAEKLIIQLDVKVNAQDIAITYTDNGMSFDSPKSSGHLGLMIIDSMVKQLKGRYERNGSAYTIHLQVKN
jgi:two-component sensor histidine kinase